VSARLLVAATAGALLAGGCGAKHVRDCEGGLEIQVFVPIDDLDDAEELYVLVGIDESPDQFWEHTWSASELDDNGFGDLVLRIPVEEPTRLTIIGQLRGPGDTVLASASVPFIIQPLDSGCQRVTLGMGGAGQDGSVVDAEDLIDAQQPADACTANPDQCPADAGGPPDSIENMDSLPGDFDGDGIADGSDNCMFVYNPDQNDEDGDGDGDRCDNCPIDANPDQQNIDPDEVGDACDPHFNDPLWTDYIQWMDGFGSTVAEEVPITGYAVVGPPWSKTGGKARNGTTTGSCALQVPNFSLVPSGGDDELRVYTQANVTTVAATAGNKGAGLTNSTVGDLASGWRCLGRMNSDTLAIDNLGDNSNVGSQGGFTAGEDTALPIFFWSYPNQFLSATNLECDYQIGVFTLQNDPQPPTGGSFGLTTSGVYAEFDYLFAIVSKPTGVSPPMDGGL
jgi:hypothetical protein